VNTNEKIFQVLDSINTRLDSIDTRLDGIDTRLDGIDTRLDGIDTRLDDMDERFDAVDERFDMMDKRLDGMDTRLGGLEREVHEIKVVQENVTNKHIQILLEGNVSMNNKLDSLQTTVNDIDSSVSALDVLHKMRPHNL